MGFFDFFSSKQKKLKHYDTMAWARVTGTLSGTLWSLIHENPAMLADPYARVVLSKDWHPGIAARKPIDGDHYGKNGVAFVFLREDEKSLQEWVKSLEGISPVFGQALTQQYAAFLVRKLQEQVEVV